MRVPSNSSKTLRVVPRQERSERRVAAFLDAAAALFAELGYERVTMTAVAAHSGSSIGALYNYFPDKQSLAFTLAVRYTQALEAKWKPLMEQASSLTTAQFADQLIDRILELAHEQPAFIVLITAPVRFRRDPAARRASRQIIADAFRARQPALSKETAYLIANISLQIINGMMLLYADADAKGKATLVAEYKKLFAAYLKGALTQR